jgi:hypothetical protein
VPSIDLSAPRSRSSDLEPAVVLGESSPSRRAPSRSRRTVEAAFRSLENLIALCERPWPPRLSFASSWTTRPLPCRSEERLGCDWSGLLLYRLSGSSPGVKTLRRAPRHHETVPLIRHRAPTFGHLSGSGEPFGSLSSGSRSSDVNESAVQVTLGSEELRPPLPARPTTSLGLSYRPLLATSPNSPTVKQDTSHPLENVQSNRHQTSCSEEHHER